MKQSFWVTNISNRNVSLTDLNLTIKTFTTVNLLDNRHYDYTLEQLQESAIGGSLFNKRTMVVVREYGPDKISKTVPFDRETFIPTRQRSIFSMKEESYEELNVTDEQFAEENAETADLDAKRQIISKG